MAIAKRKTARHRERAQSAETRRTILSAAERCFGKAGLAGARTDVIAAEAGVNKALLYYYFKSKEQLYEAVIEDHFREFNEQALEVLSGPGSARAVLLKYVSLHFDFISERHRYAALYHQVMTTGGKLAKRIIDKYFVPRSDAFQRLLDRGMREGEFRQTDRLHSAVSIVALIVFYFSASGVLQLLGYKDAFSGASLQQRKREVLDFIRYGLFKDPESPIQ